MMATHAGACAQPPKGEMSQTLTGLAGLARHLFAYARAVATIPEPEPIDYPFAPSDVAQLHRVTQAGGAPSLDDQTWNDLLLERYLGELSGEASIFGRQELYRRLRAGATDDARQAQRERVEALMRDPAALQDIHRRMRSQRAAEAEVAELLFEGERPAIPRWAGRTWPLPLGLVASLAALALSPLAWLGVAAVMYVLITAQMRYYERVQAWERRTRALQLLLRSCTLLADVPGLVARGFPGAREQAGRISRALSRSALARVIPGAQGYRDWFMLANVNHYFKTVALVFDNRAFLRDCLLRCAALEADVALARHLLGRGLWCWAQGCASRETMLDGALHPLLPSPAPLSLALDGKGAFISGQNGVGKSTFLRTLGVNLVTANAFGFCYARRARAPMLPVYASMQGEDSLLGGESLYMAELRRARELLAAPRCAIFLVDEIFRGTNHVESVSAAAAVLDTLAARSPVVVASHHLELASLLAHRLDPYCIRRTGASLALEPGVLAETNGIALLAAQGFGRDVQDKAARVARWLERYLAEPQAGKAVLGVAVTA